MQQTKKAEAFLSTAARLQQSGRTGNREPALPSLPRITRSSSHESTIQVSIPGPLADFCHQPDPLWSSSHRALLSNSEAVRERSREAFEVAAVTEIEPKAPKATNKHNCATQSVQLPEVGQSRYRFI